MPSLVSLTVSDGFKAAAISQARKEAMAQNTQRIETGLRTISRK